MGQSEHRTNQVAKDEVNKSYCETRPDQVVKKDTRYVEGADGTHNYSISM
jgi:hypothetical protein